MKVLFISLALSCLVGFSTLASIELDKNVHLEGIFDGIINSTINKILNNITDPLKLGDISIKPNETETKLKGELHLTNVYAFGIKSLVASYINLDLFTSSLNMTIQIPHLSLKFNYGVDITVADLVPMYGSGDSSIDLTGVVLDVTGKADMSNGIKVKDVAALLTLGSATFNLNGLLNNPEFSALVNNALDDNFVPFINQNNHLLSNIFGKVLESIINGALKS